jgi:antitoxin (DNA-binding transcriptional repressor) of toxin-antitoxin stability system
MKTIAIGDATKSLAEYAGKLGKDIVVVTKHNKPVAAIVPLKATDRESIALSMHPEFLKLIARSRRQFSAGKALSMTQMRKAVLPPAAASPVRKKNTRTR